MSKPSIDPARWSPPRDPGLQGRFTPTASQLDLHRWSTPGAGPEDVAVDSGGRVYTGTNDGAILRLSKGGALVEEVARTGGRPLGIEVDSDGTLVVCDAHRGLLRIDPETGTVGTLVAAEGPVTLTFTNNCSIAGDGSVYFSDSSTTFALEHFKGDLLEGRASGRLLRWTPDGSVDVIAEGFRFANGVALAPDGSFVLVAETAGYCVTRIETSGERAGHRSTVLDNLPGLPDNMSTGSGGVFWIAVPSERNALLDRLLPKPGALRRAVWALPDRLQPEANRVVLVIGITGDGEVRHVLRAPGDRFHYVTGVREHDGWLYLGSLVEEAVARVRVPELAAP